MLTKSISSVHSNRRVQASQRGGGAVAQSPITARVANAWPEYTFAILATASVVAMFFKNAWSSIDILQQAVIVIAAAHVIWRRQTIAPPQAVEHLERLTDVKWQMTDMASRHLSMLETQAELIERRKANGAIVFANRAYCAAFDVTLEQIANTSYRPKPVAVESPRSNLGASQRQVELFNSAAGPIWVAWEDLEILAADGSTEHQRIGHDVTEDRRVATELRHARDQAEAANRGKSRFLAAMSHEIRTPMNGILGMTSLLSDTTLSSEQTSYTRAIDQSARALLALIDEILDFSKIEAGKIELAYREFSLRECLARASDLLLPRITAKGLTLRQSIANDIPDYVLGDETRVRQILLNLLSNAVKFTDHGSISVSIRCLRPESSLHSLSRIAIEVRDTGIGLSDDAIARLFDEFEQGDNAVSRQQGGTGLGLAISKRLARAMGGDITASGQTGVGAAFTVVLRLPSAGAATPQPRIVPDSAISSLGAGSNSIVSATNDASVPIRVLIAEDNEINALLASRVVEKLGAQPTIVNNGRAAVSAVADTIAGGGPYFDVILMDVFMPLMDGLEATSAIAALFADHAARGVPAAPIIALTANAYPEDRARCLAIGMSDYLAKPFDAQQLNGILKRWVVRQAVVPDVTRDGTAA